MRTRNFNISLNLIDPRLSNMQLSPCFDGELAFLKHEVPQFLHHFIFDHNFQICILSHVICNTQTNAMYTLKLILKWSKWTQTRYSNELVYIYKCTQIKYHICTMYKRIGVHVNFCNIVVHVDNEIYVYTIMKNILVSAF